MGTWELLGPRQLWDLGSHGRGAVGGAAQWAGLMGGMPTLHLPLFLSPWPRPWEGARRLRGGVEGR